MAGKGKTYFKISVRECIAFVKEKRLALSVCVLVYLSGIFFFLRRGMKLYGRLGLKTCTADCYVMAGMVGRRISAGLPAFLAVTLLQAGNWHGAGRVMRLKSRRGLWMGCVLSNGFRAVAFSIIETIAVGVYGALLSPVPFIWEEQGAVFWYATGQTAAGISFRQVVFSFWVVSFLNYMFTGMLFSFVGWVTDSFPAGICTCLALAFAEDYSRLSFLYDRTTIFYSAWQERAVGGNCLWALLVIMVFMLAGIRAADRKEFYGT